jgi:hypothetical protein
MAAGIYEDCSNPYQGLPPASCERLAEAVRAKDRTSCAEMPEGVHDWCVALATSNPAACPNDDQDCRELASRLRMLEEGGGLSRVAREGTPRDRVVARAALHGLPACEPYVDDFAARCRPEH